MDRRICIPLFTPLRNGQYIFYDNFSVQLHGQNRFEDIYIVFKRVNSFSFKYACSKAEMNLKSTFEYMEC